MKRKLRWLVATVCFSVSFLCLPSFTFFPVVQDFSPAGPLSRQQFHLFNDGEEAVTVELTLQARTVNIDGEDQLSFANEDFHVSPSLVHLGKNEGQVVHVAWNGSEFLNSEKAYRLIAKQRPEQKNAANADTSTLASQGDIKLLFQYYVAVYVAPDDAKPYITLDSVEPVVNSQGEKQIVVTLSNRGTKRMRLRDFNFEFLPLDGAERGFFSKLTTVSSRDFPELDNKVLLANATRRYTLPWPQGVELGPVAARLVEGPWIR
ncbi:molecular chaperone [Simkania negevensis]|uniref:Molecular chaperone n=1 Tax=Simkania negevensis TaxID=83561 RepID=A0ABS3ASU1_9BACT|nr:molecular chaperone [Simkania negevensis]